MPSLHSSSEQDRKFNWLVYLSRSHHLKRVCHSLDGRIRAHPRQRVRRHSRCYWSETLQSRLGQICCLRRFCIRDRIFVSCVTVSQFSLSESRVLSILFVKAVKSSTHRANEAAVVCKVYTISIIRAYNIVYGKHDGGILERMNIVTSTGCGYKNFN